MSHSLSISKTPGGEFLVQLFIDEAAYQNAACNFFCGKFWDQDASNPEPDFASDEYPDWFHGRACGYDNVLIGGRMGDEGYLLEAIVEGEKEGDDALDPTIEAVELSLQQRLDIAAAFRQLMH